MADPFRLRLLKKVTEVIASVTPANGYQHDLSTSVFRGRMMFGETDPLPMVSILELPVQPDQLPVPEESSAAHGEFELLIQGFVVDDPLNPTDPAHLLMADVKKALVQEKTRDDNILGFGTKVTALRIGGGSCRPADEVSDKAYFWLPLILRIVEDLDDPFA